MLIQTDDKDFSDQNVQTDFFGKYPCNYCGTKIANRFYLAEHTGRSRGTLNMGSTPGLPMLPYFSLRFTRQPNFLSNYIW